MLENRLELIDPKLSAQLKQASDVQLRAAGLAACRFGVQRTGLEDSLIQEALQAIETVIGWSFSASDATLRSNVEDLVAALDEEQWNVQDAFDQGQVDQREYEIAFGRARAANAVYFALAPDAFQAATESIYEAHAATDDWAQLSKIVSDALK